MSWFRVDDKAAFHRKVLKAGNEAFGAFCRAGAMSSGEGTDGRLTVETCEAIAPKKVWDKLVAAGLAERIEGSTDLQMHDYLQWNPSAAEVDEAREAKRLAGAKGGRTKALNRSSGLAPASGLPSASLAPARADGVADALGNSGIIPSHPIPSHPVEEESARGALNLELAVEVPPSKPTESSPQVQEVWDAYVEGWQAHVGRGAKPVLSDARKRLIKARLKEHPVDVVSRAAAGIWASPWHREQGQTSLDLAMRSTANVERFSGDPPKPATSNFRGPVRSVQPSTPRTTMSLDEYVNSPANHQGDF